ncbi:MAG: glycosyl transferase [Marmoricola sp.]|nr:glycosyl transferase [Marmoricola sp.]
MSSPSRWRSVLGRRRGLLPGRGAGPDAPDLAGLDALTVVLRSSGDPARDADQREVLTAAGLACVLGPPDVVELPTDLAGLVTFLEPGDQPQPEALARLVQQVERAGAQVGRGGVAQRTGTSPPRRLTRQRPAGAVDPRQRPEVLALVDLRGLVVDAAAWRAVTRDVPGPWDGPAQAGTRVVLAAPAVAVVPDLVVVTDDSAEVDLPVERRRRHRADRCAAVCRGIAAASADLPEDLRAPHAAALVEERLGDLVVDALAGRATGFPEVAALARLLVDRLAAPEVRAGLTVEDRLRAWVAAHGTTAEVRSAAAYLLRHPRGLPHRDQVVVGPEDWLDRVPPEWRRLEPADRRLRVRLLEPQEEGGTWRLRGNALVTATSDGVPRVEVDGVVLPVTVRPDPSAGVWAASDHEDHDDCGFEATAEEGTLPAPPPGGRRVRVTLHGLSETRVVAEPGRAPGPSVVVLAGFDIADGGLDVTGHGPAAHLRLVGPLADSGWVATRPGADGAFTVSLPLTTTLFSREVGLPAGRYAVQARGRDGTERPLAWGAALADPATERVGPRMSLRPVGADGLVVGPPVALRDDSARSRQVRMNLWTPQGTASLRRTVVLESFAGRSVADNPLAVGRELARRDLDLDLAWLVDDPSVEVPEGTRAVPRRTPEMFAVLADAAAYVSNASAPDWWRKRPGMVHVQTWHGVPLKRIGEDRGPGDLATWRHRETVASQAAGWDVLVSPSPFCSPIFRSAFRFGGTLLEAGQPRNDVLLGPGRDAVGARVREELGLAADARIVLYAPTWRDHAGHRVAKPVHLDVPEFLAGSPGTTLLVRGHYNASRQRDLHHEGRVVDVTRYPDAADLLCAADALVTDYSSVMFDFCLTDRPVVLLVPDLETYRDVHPGMYFDIAERAPGAVVRDTRGVLAALARPADADAQARADFRAAYFPLDDGRASARVVDRLVELAGW